MEAAIGEPYVRCEACNLDVPRRLAVIEPQGGGYLCEGCARVLREHVDERSIEGNCPTCGQPLDSAGTGDGA